MCVEVSVWLGCSGISVAGCSTTGTTYIYVQISKQFHAVIIPVLIISVWAR